MKVNDLTVVVCCNRKDVFLARICIASIRYYYPDIDIELVKDPGNGTFNTHELEKYFGVKVVDLGIKKLGWSGAKFHYLYQKPIGKKILILDADIVFIGPFLERLLPQIECNDYVVSIEENDISNKEWVRNTYFDIEAVQNEYPLYKYPGYFFNAGQIFLTLGAIDKSLLEEFFNPGKYPFWQKNKLFPLVDQSVYNYLLPTLVAEQKIKMGKEKFMIWAGGNEFLNISLQDVADKKIDLGLVHWAGCLRIPYVSKMRGGDILVQFENFYYNTISFGLLKKNKRRSITFLDFSLRNIYRKRIKKFINFKKLCGGN